MSILNKIIKLNFTEVFFTQMFTIRNSIVMLKYYIVLSFNSFSTKNYTNNKFSA